MPVLTQTYVFGMSGLGFSVVGDYVGCLNLYFVCLDLYFGVWTCILVYGFIFWCLDLYFGVWTCMLGVWTCTLGVWTCMSFGDLGATFPYFLLSWRQSSNLMIFQGYPEGDLGGPRLREVTQVRVTPSSLAYSKQLPNPDCWPANSWKQIPDWRIVNYRLQDWKGLENLTVNWWLNGLEGLGTVVASMPLAAWWPPKGCRRIYAYVYMYIWLPTNK